MEAAEDKAALEAARVVRAVEEVREAPAVREDPADSAAQEGRAVLTAGIMGMAPDPQCTDRTEDLTARITAAASAV